MGREGFKSNLGSILALAGSAVGLGNIWRFPYMVSEYGGGAFLLVYVLCIVVVSMPIMLSEFIVGRRSREGAFTAIGKLEPHGPWKHFGVLAVFIPCATLCYYCVIGGWTIDYLLKAATLKFSAGTAPQAIESMFGTLVSDPILPALFNALFLMATAVIVMNGVSGGIEKCSKVMMPVLFIIMVAIAIFTLTLPGAGEGVRYMLYPDFSRITPQVCLAAMGQAFFSLSIGMGILITYSSYLPHNSNLLKSAGSTILSDFTFALIAGFAIIPALFAFGMPTSQGTGLVFKALPVVFSRMPAGNLVATVFFLAVLLAALTSSISLFEVPVGWLVEQKHFSRRKASIVLFFAILTVGTVCSLAFGPLKNVTLGGKTIFDIFDYTVGNYLMPFAGLVVVIFVGWKMKREDKAEELCLRKGWFKALDFTIKFISPAAIIAIFLSGIL